MAKFTVWSSEHGQEREDGRVFEARRPRTRGAEVGAQGRFLGRRLPDRQRAPDEKQMAALAGSYGSELDDEIDVARSKGEGGT